MILTPQAMTDPTATAEALGNMPRSRASRCSRAGWVAMRLKPASTSSTEAGIPTFAYPDTAAQYLHAHVAVFTTTWPCTKHPTRRRADRPTLPPMGRTGRSSPRARTEGRTILTEDESKQILAAYGIPTVETRVALTEDDAVAAARVNRLPGGPQAPFQDDHPQD